MRYAWITSHTWVCYYQQWHGKWWHAKVDNRSQLSVVYSLEDFLSVTGRWWDATVTTASRCGGSRGLPPWIDLGCVIVTSSQVAPTATQVDQFIPGIHWAWDVLSRLTRRHSMYSMKWRMEQPEHSSSPPSNIALPMKNYLAWVTGNCFCRLCTGMSCA